MSNFIITQYPESPIIVGRIIKTYGVRGWLKIISFTEQMCSIFHYTPWFVWFQSQWKLLKLESWQSFNTYYIVKFFDINNREFARLFNTLDLIVDSTRFPILCSDEYYWKDIIGCQVITTTGNQLGYVSDIIEIAVHDILVVKIVTDNVTKIKTCLIPFVFNKIIKNINLFKNIIIVDWNR